MSKIIVITGATSGIGEALVERFVARGDQVFAVGRSPERLQSLKTRLQDPSNLVTFMADFARLTDLHRLAKELQAAAPSGIDVLINNAAAVPSKKRFSHDGIELQLQVNHLAVVQLTHALLESLIKRQGIVISTSSDAHKGGQFRLKDIQKNPRYGVFRTYAKTKLYNLMFSAYLKEAYGDKISVYAVHPGVVKTDLGAKDSSAFMQKVWHFFTKKAASAQTVPPTYEMLVDQKEPLEALYYAHQKPLNHLRVVTSQEKQHQLMDASLALLGLPKFGI